MSVGGSGWNINQVVHDQLILDCILPYLRRMKFDVCIVGSGAGAGPVAYELSLAGYKVCVLEKGPWIKTDQFSKDEMTATRRSVYTPNLKDERHVIVKPKKDGSWEAKSTYQTGKDYWNGNIVGGSSNFMSAYFHRLKPQDFKLKSTYGEIEGANVVDWPIGYENLEPYYTKVESIVGVSGKVVPHKHLEPRSTADFPFPPLQENVLASWLDAAASELDYDVFPSPRGIISRSRGNRKSCYYSNYCGSYGCSSGAKSSSRVALLNDAVASGNCTIIDHAKVYHLTTDGNGKVTEAKYYDAEDNKHSVTAKLFVVAAQAIETSRLLLMSKNEDCPGGLSNNNGQVGKNLVFSGGGIGSGQVLYDELNPEELRDIKQPGLFINRASQHWYEIDDESFKKPIKGGTIDFVSEHANAITKAIGQKRNSEGSLRIGADLKEQLHFYFTKQRTFKFEVFVDWLPTDNCRVELDPDVTDKWGDPVARVYVGYHDHDLEVGRYLAAKGEELFRKAGLKNVKSSISGGVSPNLQAGGCRFGDNPKTSVLDKNCKSHEIDNLYVTDGSFMPTGGSVPYTFTIYANAFRVADRIKEHLAS